MQCEVGFGKAEITAYEPEMAMMGWGRMDNRIVGVHEPLFARAIAIRRDGRLLVYCAIELMAVSLAIREEVLARLAASGVDEHNLMLTATHTHSGPSGYSHYFFLNLNGPGYSPIVFEAAVAGTVAAIEAALRNLEPAVLELAAADVPLSEPVAFNRSWVPYSANLDTEPVTRERRDEAVDRRMTVLSAKSAQGDALGCLAWFGVHCTSVHAENDRLHSDNKGIAAADLEARHRPGYVAVCAQEAAGDVSPNFRWHARRRKVVGMYDDDYRAAEFHGQVQARFAHGLQKRARPLGGDELRAGTHWVDFSRIEAAERYAGVPGARTTPGLLGLAMAEGTDEGPGPLLGLRPLTRGLARRRAKQVPGDPKVPMLDVGQGLDGRFLGTFSLRAMKVPALEPTIRYVRDVVKHPEMDEHPWIPQVMPLQLMRLGPLLIAGLPFELTTVAGRRVRAQLARLFDVETVIINSYANGYGGYCTTYEEYQLQHYEGGYTLFGPHQLAATMTMLEWMRDRWDGPMPLGARPPVFDPEALERRRFTPWTVPRAKPAW